jgi:acetylglutamate kinase
VSAIPTAAPQVRERTRAKARVLLEALPFIEEHSGSVVVVKVGGAAMEERPLAETFARDIALLRHVGVRPIVVHGGGPQITAMARRLGIEPAFLGGHRVTDAPTLEVARMVLVGIVNQDLASLLSRHGTRAIGLSGMDAMLLRVRPRGAELGFVGDIERVDVPLLEHLMASSVPVIASIGVDNDGQAYNVNADVVAGAIAVSMGASKLVYLSDVAGIIGADGELVAEASVTECRELVSSGVAGGGMIPKLESAVAAVQHGVRRAHLIDGRIEHSLILELFTPEGIGTMVVPDPVGEHAVPAGQGGIPDCPAGIPEAPADGSAPPVDSSSNSPVSSSSSPQPTGSDG